MTYLRRTFMALAACAAVAPHTAHAQSFTTLYGFTAQPDGSMPDGAPTYLNGALYGTTNTGGATDNGTIYKIDPHTGAETILDNFAGGADGGAPEGDLIHQGTTLYGTTSFGGAFNAGTAFTFDTVTGIESVLYNFGNGQDAAAPTAGLLYDHGTLYGTTATGGAAGIGTVFAIDAKSGAEKVLHNFGGGADGAEPFAGVIALNGALYGTTGFGGAANVGTIFKIELATGTETIIHAFHGSSFEGNPFGGLVANGTTLYGTTSRGGKEFCGGSGCGKVFSFDTAHNTYTTLYRFQGHLDGADPESTMVYLGGFLYGTTDSGGHGSNGTLFKVDATTGEETVLHVLNGSTDGAVPGGLIYHAGKFFATTSQESAAGFGTVFKFTP